MESIAHIRESDHKIQSVEQHLLDVKNLAEQYGEKIGIKHIAGLAGLLHDFGKFTLEFKAYIEQAVFHPENPPQKGSVDHSTAGGKFIYDLLHSPSSTPYERILAEVVGNAVISHHSYLRDFIGPSLNSAYLKRVTDSEGKLKEYHFSKECFYRYAMSEGEFAEYVNKALVELKSILNESPKQIFFLSKYIFSALIDADRTNTRQFEENTENVSSSYDRLFEDYYGKLNAHITTLRESDQADHPINVLRTKMSEQCEEYARKPSGIYKLSIPTGGGKTLASLRYGLKHALTHQKQRIIYIVPFTTIIEQNAGEVRRILKDDHNVLEHHSNVIEDINEDILEEQEEAEQNKRNKLKLARDNWDSPIIFTTMVQFLNVFYAKGNRNTKRLHNLSNAVLVFDEVQKVPVHCVSLFNEAVNFLKNDCKSSILLCTATQPSLQYVTRSLDVNAEGEIVQDLDIVEKAFRRVDMIDKTVDGTMDNEDLADWLQYQMDVTPNILVILNTKTVVRRLYEKLKERNVPVFHLSTSMCAAHRREQLEEIKTLLEKEAPFICISTQLIEAGVDVSFQCVVRSLAGLDSLAQAAGRCNRHGKFDKRPVYLIDHAEEKLDRLKEIEVGKRIVSKMLVDLQQKPLSHGGNLLSNQAMEFYFREFYAAFENDVNYYVRGLSQTMVTLLMSKKKNNPYVKEYLSKHQSHLPLMIGASYQTAAENFRVIDDITTAVIVPFEGGKEIIAEFNSGAWEKDTTSLFKRAQQFTINLYQHELKRLSNESGLEVFLDGQVFALREGFYSEEYGLDLEGAGGMGDLFL
ncbi:CRISPR-associated helicase Cas3' [Aureibacillus halotolerans]|uniref:CRISPR-associated Cas3 family helicase n=1 Tax=Aureibacillus halotolerans TaxID=1508390 RepID=A0A4R6TVD4_9BACI|nr:CRISPR-associated helicase Cas3' [Aureibacillus halotolerans]TDQ37156.1 CRISPR-associated Cas3 family helicase [Aureibacillus halotolerans]